jgi:hypothetical protein
MGYVTEEHWYYGNFGWNSEEFWTGKVEEL